MPKDISTQFSWTDFVLSLEYTPFRFSNCDLSFPTRRIRCEHVQEDAYGHSH